MAKSKPEPTTEDDPKATDAKDTSKAKGAPKPKDDELHQRFREALERKNARHEHHPHSGPSHLGVGDAHNDRQRRQFRRKSG
ncbi:MAG: DUF5302 domain-containing protein [Micromonosporaceae bacterium]